VELFNRRCYWTSIRILDQVDIKEVTNALKLMIETALECRKLRNFFSCFAMVTGISTTPVTRLEKAWRKLGSRLQKRFAVLQDELSSDRNFIKYRTNLEEGAVQGKPQLPHLAILLKDFFQLEEIPHIDKKTHIVSFHKYSKQWRGMVAGLFHSQRLKYNLKSDEKLKIALQDEIQKVGTDEEERLWELTWRHLPRGGGKI